MSATPPQDQPTQNQPPFNPGAPTSSPFPQQLPTPVYGQPYGMSYVAPPPSYLAAPAASGSLVQAWFSTAVHFSRDNISSWMKASKGSWVAIYFVVLGIFGGLNSALGVYRTMTTLSNTYTIRAYDTASPSRAEALHHLANLLLEYRTTGALIASITFPILGVLGILFLSWFLALFAPKEMGTIGVRLATVMRATAVSTFVPLLLNGLVSITAFALIPSQFLYAEDNFTTSNPFVSLPLNLISFFIGVYSLALTIQSGATATTLSRWAVLGINLLGSFILGIVITLLVVCPTILIVAGIIRSAF